MICSDATCEFCEVERTTHVRAVLPLVEQTPRVVNLREAFDAEQLAAHDLLAATVAAMRARRERPGSPEHLRAVANRDRAATTYVDAVDAVSELLK